MRAVNLPSSLILRAVYHDRQRSLRITFVSGATYVYDDVPPDIYERLKAAPSAGAYYNRHIKGRFRCRYDPERRRFRPTGAEREDTSAA